MGFRSKAERKKIRLSVLPHLFELMIFLQFDGRENHKLFDVESVDAKTLLNLKLHVINGNDFHSALLGLRQQAYQHLENESL